MSGTNVPKQVLDVLPSDPFEQLDIARKITSIALSTRVSSLESESSILREEIAGRDDVIVDLESKLGSLDFSLSQDLHNLSLADHQKVGLGGVCFGLYSGLMAYLVLGLCYENLLKENASLLETVNKLKRDVAKLETFRTTLMMSLQDEEESLARGPPEYEESTSSIQSHSSNVGNSYHYEHVTDASRPRISQSLLLSSQSSTPWLTPPDTPPTLSASASPTRTPPPVSPRRHSFSAAPTGGTFDDRSSVYSSANSSPYASMTGQTRVDSKEFFRQVRSRLAYEQFAAFLANVKELNSQKQSKEASVFLHDTLRKADEILGPDNKDLYAIFESGTDHQTSAKRFWKKVNNQYYRVHFVTSPKHIHSRHTSPEVHHFISFHPPSSTKIS
ncbi:hypothetical protein CTI12_AA501740 [Artemisia annua]|uniref:At4g15545-like C-terminal domain-containing protein n=1 Tax=Artemisia annua TaxID=35608 RepID=A0A2U1LDT7_ARTAN|nr:hypothetical protein CTI12_AA501740 [Artemisia annua]